MPNYQYVKNTGVIVVDTSTVLEEVRGEWKAALGDDLDLSGNTGQGMLIAAQTAARSGMLQNNAALANQINPGQSGGIFLDGLYALSGGKREPATYSLLTGVILGGQVGTNIGAGQQARVGQTGPIFELVSAVTIGPDGTATGTFQAVDAGPIPCAAGALDTPLVGGLLGWETVSNPLAAQVGSNEQTDASVRALRRRRIAQQGRSLSEAITSNLYAVDGVRSLQFRENVENTTQTIDGIVMPPNSVWACVYGGTDLDVATALYNAKTGGAKWAGATSVQVTDKFSGQVATVKFDRPTVIQAKCKVTVSQGTATSVATEAIPQAVVDYANGINDEHPEFEEAAFRVGVPVSPFEVSWAVNVEQPGYVVRKVDLGVNGSAYPANPTVLDIALNQVPVITASLVEVVIV